MAYILAPDGLEEGKVLQCGEGAPFEVGNAMPMGTIPDGFDIHNVEPLPMKYSVNSPLREQDFH